MSTTEGGENVRLGIRGLTAFRVKLAVQREAKKTVQRKAKTAENQNRKGLARERSMASAWPVETVGTVGTVKQGVGWPPKAQSSRGGIVKVYMIVYNSGG